MNELINITPRSTGKPGSMSSLEIADVVDKRHDNVKRTIESLVSRGSIQLPQTEDIKNHLGQTVEVYNVGERDSYVVVAQLSPEFTARLVDYWQAHKDQQVRIPTTAEAFASAFQMLAESERRHTLQDARIQSIGEKVEMVAQAMTVMSSRPANAESIVHIRKRIWKMFGLSDSTIDDVMRQSPYAPKSAGTVRNGHAGADNSTYVVYWQKDVTAMFQRFVDECTPVTAAFYTHPFVEGRFKLSRKEKLAA